MTSPPPEMRLPTVSVALPSPSSEDDAAKEAAKRISPMLKPGHVFQIVSIDIVEDGLIKTPLGVVQGKRYQVAFMTKENVVFLHPDYDKIMAEYWKLRRP